MEGVFVNLTDNDIIFKPTDNTKATIITKVDSLMSSYKSDVNKKNNSTILGQNGTELHSLSVSKFKGLGKDHFTDKQIEKINSICNGHTRLLIMDMEEAIGWISPHSEYAVPFTRYRILVPQFTEKGFIKGFIEFQKPDTLLKSALKFLNNKKTELKDYVEDISGTPPTSTGLRSSESN
jgi:ethanolamine utilization cobalamin adenosyltransferase